MHVEFVRIWGQIAAFGLQLERYTTEARLNEIMAELEATGNPAFKVTSVKLVEIRVRREVAIGQAARGGIWIGSAVSVAASSAMASTCM